MENCNIITNTEYTTENNLSRLRGCAKKQIQKSEITMGVGGWGGGVQMSLGICVWKIIPK